MYFIIMALKNDFWIEADHEPTIEEATRLVKSPVLKISPISSFIFKIMTM